MLSIILQTERLLLRPPAAADISKFTPLIGDFDVAKNLGRVPHPYSEDDGCAWTIKNANDRLAGNGYTFAILRKSDGAYVGMCGVHSAEDFNLGYWIGKPYWGQGYATEAARRVVRFAFDELGAPTVTARWFFDNPISGHILEKLGFKHCGSADAPCLSRGKPVFCHNLSLTRADFDAADGNR
jgi:ribosomal-protein-alanine N-acetyltransferase